MKKAKAARQDSNYSDMATCLSRTELGTESFIDMFEKHPVWALVNENRSDVQGDRKNKQEFSLESLIPQRVWKQFNGLGAANQIKDWLRFKMSQLVVRFTTHDQMKLLSDRGATIPTLADGDIKPIMLIIKQRFKELQRAIELLIDGPAGLNHVYDLIEEMLILLKMVTAQIAIIMDLYVIGRLLKPYISDAIVCQGVSHTLQQMYALTKLGFVIEAESPQHATSMIPELETGTKKELKMGLLPLELQNNLQIIHVAGALEDGGPLLGVHYTPFTCARQEWRTVDQLPKLSITQCIDVTNLPLC
jgi:hypothetical protein